MVLANDPDLICEYTERALRTIFYEGNVTADYIRAATDVVPDNDIEQWLTKIKITGRSG
jgi:hypothetical protein